MHRKFQKIVINIPCKSQIFLEHFGKKIFANNIRQVKMLFIPGRFLPFLLAKHILLHDKFIYKINESRSMDLMGKSKKRKMNGGQVFQLLAPMQCTCGKQAEIFLTISEERNLVSFTIIKSLKYLLDLIRSMLSIRISDSRQ